MNKYLTKIMIVDGSYILHRSLNTPGLQDLETKYGVKTGGVYGSIKILQSELRKYNDYFPIVCFDKGLSSRRVALYEDYKANRKRQQADSLKAVGQEKESEDYLKEYQRQRADLIRLLTYLGIPSLLIPGWEGDDLQYLLTKVCDECIVLSDDKDMIQLVSPTCKIRRSMRDELIEWDENDTYYHHPRFTIRKTIVGDKSDNILKCGKGVGEKSADQIAILLENIQGNDYQDTLNRYKETLEQYIRDNGNEKGLGKKVQSLLDDWSRFVLNYQLIDLHLVEAPPSFEEMIKDLITMVVGKPNLMKSYGILGQYEMESIYPDQIINMINRLSKKVFKNS